MLQRKRSAAVFAKLLEIERERDLAAERAQFFVGFAGGHELEAVTDRRCHSLSRPLASTPKQIAVDVDSNFLARHASKATRMVTVNRSRATSSVTTVDEHHDPSPRRHALPSGLRVCQHTGHDLRGDQIAERRAAQRADDLRAVDVIVFRRLPKTSALVTGTTSVVSAGIRARAGWAP
jgi:hypothetical protein